MYLDNCILYIRNRKSMLFTVSDDGIYTVNCELFILEKRNAVMQFIIDTGASITCCRAKELGISSEKDFITNKVSVRYLNGILKEGNKEYSKDSYSIKFYEVKIKKLKIGTSILLPNVSIWVTFDSRFYTCLIGQDILDKLNYMHSSNAKKLFLSDKVDDLREYINNI